MLELDCLPDSCPTTLRRARAASDSPRLERQVRARRSARRGLLALTLPALGAASLVAVASTALAQGLPGDPPASVTPLQKQFGVQLDGVSAVQLAWWFQHLADEGGVYFKDLAPATNLAIEWAVSPTDDAHHIIGSVFRAEQHIPGASLANDRLSLQAQFADYVTTPRSRVPGQPAALTFTLGYPAEYTAPYPTPLAGTPGPNGFNQHMVLTDGQGFAIAHVLWSWQNLGADDTQATAGMTSATDLLVTFQLPWMAGSNRPAALAQDGYYYTPEQLDAIWAGWEPMLQNLPNFLPHWFGVNTQDDLARAQGWSTVTVVDTGIAEGVSNEMTWWWWNHAMGDAPGNGYVRWCPQAHLTIRWLPGFSPAELSPTGEVPSDDYIPGQIYPDLQLGGLVQSGGGMMAYPREMSPIPGIYEHMMLMQIVSAEQVANFATERFPAQSRLLLHQWEEREGGAIHRATLVQRLPLPAATTQSGFYNEHMLMEGAYFPNAAKRAWRLAHPAPSPTPGAASSASAGGATSSSGEGENTSIEGLTPADEVGCSAAGGAPASRGVGALVGAALLLLARRRWQRGRVASLLPVVSVERLHARAARNTLLMRSGARS